MAFNNVQRAPVRLTHNRRRLQKKTTNRQGAYRRIFSFIEGNKHNEDCRRDCYSYFGKHNNSDRLVETFHRTTLLRLPELWKQLSGGEQQTLHRLGLELNPRGRSRPKDSRRNGGRKQVRHCGKRWDIIQKKIGLDKQIFTLGSLKALTVHAKKYDGIDCRKDVFTSMKIGGLLSNLSRSTPSEAFKIAEAIIGEKIIIGHLRLKMDAAKYTSVIPYCENLSQVQFLIDSWSHDISEGHRRCQPDNATRKAFGALLNGRLDFMGKLTIVRAIRDGKMNIGRFPIEMSTVGYSAVLKTCESLDELKTVLKLWNQDIKFCKANYVIQKDFGALLEILDDPKEMIKIVQAVVNEDLKIGKFILKMDLVACVSAFKSCKTLEQRDCLEKMTLNNFDSITEFYDVLGASLKQGYIIEKKIHDDNRFLQSFSQVFQDRRFPGITRKDHYVRIDLHTCEHVLGALMVLCEIQKTLSDDKGSRQKTKIMVITGRGTHGSNGLHAMYKFVTHAIRNRFGNKLKLEAAGDKGMFVISFIEPK